MRLILLLTLVFSGLATSVQAQTRSDATEDPRTSQHVASSAAYAEIALRTAEVRSELESLRSDYTDEYPKVKELKQYLELLRRETLRVGLVKISDRDRLTAALGKLIVKKTELEVELWRLRQTYSDEHPDVRRASKRVEIFENAIKEILG